MGFRGEDPCSSSVAVWNDSGESAGEVARGPKSAAICRYLSAVIRESSEPESAVSVDWEVSSAITGRMVI